MIRAIDYGHICCQKSLLIFLQVASHHEVDVQKESRQGLGNNLGQVYFCAVAMHTPLDHWIGENTMKIDDA